MPATKLSTTGDIEKLVESYDTFLLDCDGVLWHNDDLIPGVKETMSYLRSLGKNLIFVTNNATKSRKSYKTKFDKLGIDASESEIFGSAYATAVYMRYNLKFPKDKKVYVVGMHGIEDEFASEDITTIGGTHPDDNVLMKEMDFTGIEPDASVGAVVCGFDISVNYRKLAKAYTYLQNPDCLFLLTNNDSTFPANGTLYPGAGSLSAPLIYATGRTPTVVGKPNKPMLECILEKFKFDPAKTCMVGDRLDTDIQFGINGGIASLLVLTGVSKESEIQGTDAKIVPKYVMESWGRISEVAK